MMSDEEYNDELIQLPGDDEKLLDECDLDTFRSSGKGGQHVNKTETAVRLTHRPTGIVVTSQSERSQYRNKMECIEKLRARVEQANERQVPRIPTKKPRKVKEKRLQEKKIQSQKKELRKPPSFD